MGLFGNSKKIKALKKEIIQIENNVKFSFEKIKEERTYFNQWINYFQQRSYYYESQLSNIQNDNQKITKVLNENTDEIDKNSKLIEDFTDNLANLSSSLDTLNQSDDSEYKNEINFHIEKIYSHLQRNEQKIESFNYLSPSVKELQNQFLEHLKSPHQALDVDARITAINEKLNTLIIKKTPKEKLVQKVTKNRHDYLKTVIYSYIRKYEKISAFQLREMVVEEQNMTSKSTFYRILEEIESEEGISIIWEGKEKIYLSKAKKTT